MVCPGTAHLLVVVVVGILGVSDAVHDDTQFPSLQSLLTVLGSKPDFPLDYYNEDNSGSDEPQVPAKPCCYPLVWEGSSVHVDSHFAGKGGLGITRIADNFHVDGKNQRLAGHLEKYDMITEKLTANMSWIFHIGSNRTGDYYRFERSTEKCEHRVVRNVVWHRQCIPDSATYRGTFYMGPIGNLTVNSWSFYGQRRAADADGDNPSRPHVDYAQHVGVVPGTCVPVSTHTHGFSYHGLAQQQLRMNDRPGPPRPKPGGVGFVGSQLFINARTHIADLSVFDVPSYCKKGDAKRMDYGEDSESVGKLPTILEHYLVL